MIDRLKTDYGSVADGSSGEEEDLDGSLGIRKISVAPQFVKGVGIFKGTPPGTTVLADAEDEQEDQGMSVKALAQAIDRRGSTAM